MKFKMIASAFFLFCFCLRSQLFTEASNPRKLNVKAVQIDQGKIIDCVDIYSQPSLGHPLLKNHKIQLRPSAFPLDGSTVSSKKLSKLVAYRKESCPDGTVPIYRTTEEEKLIAKNLTRKVFRKTGRSVNFPTLSPNVHEIIVRMNTSGGKTYHGIDGTISLFDLNVTGAQMSTSNIWAEGGPDDQFNYIVAGSFVVPSFYGDNKPRITLYWSTDGGKTTGCINLVCKGFIQISKDIGPGSIIQPLSKIGGQIYEEKFLLYQDPVTGNWWFAVSAKNVLVGYFPKELLPRLGDGATDVAWGGISVAGDDNISPPMGSGQYPDGFYDTAAYFRHIQFLDKSLNQTSPQHDDPNISEVVADSSGCFKLQNDKLTDSDFWGYRFSFGGPGGGTFCKH